LSDFASIVFFRTTWIFSRHNGVLKLSASQVEEFGIAPRAKMLRKLDAAVTESWHNHYRVTEPRTMR